MRNAWGYAVILSMQGSLVLDKKDLIVTNSLCGQASFENARQELYLIIRELYITAIPCTLCMNEYMQSLVTTA